jgi:hypothetical protein
MFSTRIWRIRNNSGTHSNHVTQLVGHVIKNIAYKIIWTKVLIIKCQEKCPCYVSNIFFPRYQRAGLCKYEAMGFSSSHLTPRMPLADEYCFPKQVQSTASIYNWVSLVQKMNYGVIYIPCKLVSGLGKYHNNEGSWKTSSSIFNSSLVSLTTSQDPVPSANLSLHLPKCDLYKIVFSSSILFHNS